MSDATVNKRCDCGEAKWTKCGDPWYMGAFWWQGHRYRDCVTDWARAVLHETITTKTRAEEVAEEMRSRIRAGTFVSARAARKATPPPDAAMTLTALIALFEREVLDVKTGDADDTSDETVEANKARLKALAAFEGCGARPAAALDYAMLKRFRTSAAMRAQGRSSWGKHWGVYRRLTRFGAHAGVLPRDPLATEALSEAEYDVVRRRKPEPRGRRLRDGEEAGLLQAARVGKFAFDVQRLLDVIVAALECAGRKGELFALKVGDCYFPPGGDPFLIFTATEKGARKRRGKSRVVPISERLLPVLLRRLTSTITGEPLPPTAYVFGNEVGERITRLKSWEVAIARMELGHEPALRRGNLDTKARAAYHGSDLHFHDLRRECASRWHERGVYTLAEIQATLGHTNLAQTSEYLGIQPGSPFASLRRYQAEQRRLAAEPLPLAVGSNGHTSATSPDAGADTGAGPRLVKGNKARGDSTLPD